MAILYEDLEKCLNNNIFNNFSRIPGIKAEICKYLKSYFNVFKKFQKQDQSLINFKKFQKIYSAIKKLFKKNIWNNF
jgi:phage replication-related protein YjqB (UPF0714/DUF867 family)